MTFNRIAQNSFAALLVLALVTTVVVQARSAEGLPRSTAFATPTEMAGALRFKVSLSIHTVPTPSEEAKKTDCKPWINGLLPQSCSRFAGLTPKADLQNAKSYKVELKVYDLASLTAKTQ